MAQKSLGKRIQVFTNKKHLVLKHEIWRFFPSLNQYYGIITALQKCIYWLRLLLSWAMWPMGLLSVVFKFVVYIQRAWFCLNKSLRLSLALKTTFNKHDLNLVTWDRTVTNLLPYLPGLLNNFRKLTTWSKPLFKWQSVWCSVLHSVFYLLTTASSDLYSSSNCSSTCSQLLVEILPITDYMSCYHHNYQYMRSSQIFQGMISLSLSLSLSLSSTNTQMQR